MKPAGLLVLLLIIAGLIALNVYLRIWLFIRDRRARRNTPRDEANRASRDSSH